MERDGRGQVLPGVTEKNFKIVAGYLVSNRAPLECKPKGLPGGSAVFSTSWHNQPPIRTSGVPSCFVRGGSNKFS